MTLNSCHSDKETGELLPNTAIIGEWQKYKVMLDDGTFETGDLDEFWIFNADGSFRNEDGGAITAIGTYKIVNDTQLTINSNSVEDPSREENFSGTFVIDGVLMTYEFTDLSDGYNSTIIFKKM